MKEKQEQEPQKKFSLPKIGLRKVKSLISVCMAFLVWQVIRLIVPYDLDIHPLFGYIYGILEIRETPEKSKLFSFYRIKATLVGLSLGLMLLPLSVYMDEKILNTPLNALANLGLILAGVLVALLVSELVKCHNFCGVAAIIFVICMVRDRSSNTNIYAYAILRTVQTFVGIFSACVVNSCFFKKHNPSEIQK